MKHKTGMLAFVATRHHEISYKKERMYNNDHNTYIFIFVFTRELPSTIIHWLFGKKIVI